MTGQELVDRAKALALPFVGQMATAPGPLLQQINALDTEVVDLVLRVAPQALSTAGSTVAIGNHAANAAGYALTAARSYTDFKYVDNEGYTYPITIVPETHFDDPSVHPSAIVAGSTLLPCDPAMSRWTESGDQGWWLSGDTVEYRYVANPTPLTVFSGTLASPTFAQNYMTWALVLHILLAFHGHEGIVPQARLEMVMQLRQTAYSDLAMTIARLSPVTSSLRGIGPI